MEIPAPAARAAEAFLDATDFMAPNLVEGLYLRGSLLWGEFFPGSDVDFTALLTRAPDANDCAALAAAHRAVRETVPGVSFDGHHLTRDQLAAPPAECAPVPVAFAGEFHPAHELDVNPVTWHELAERGHVVAGPRVGDLGIHTDDAELRAFAVGNLTSYWRPLQGRLLAGGFEQAGHEAVAPWCVLGISRLVHLLATGELTAKSAAGRWALTDFGAEHAAIVTEALRARETPEEPSAYPSAEQRARATLAFLDAAFARAAQLAS